MPNDESKLGRWEQAEQIAHILKINKVQAYALLPTLDEKDLTRYVMSEQEWAIAEALKCPYYGKAVEEVSDLPVAKKKRAKREAASNADKPMGNVECVKLAMWYIEKIGDAEKAKTAFDAAYNAVKAFGGVHGEGNQENVNKQPTGIDKQESTDTGTTPESKQEGL